MTIILLFLAQIAAILTVKFVLEFDNIIKQAKRRLSCVPMDIWELRDKLDLEKFEPKISPLGIATKPAIKFWSDDEFIQYYKDNYLKNKPI